MSQNEHSPCDFDEKLPPQHLHSNQPLNDHGGAKTKSTWCFAMASFLLAQSWENIPKRKNNGSVKKP